MSDQSAGAGEDDITCQRCGEDKPIESYESAAHDEQADLCDECYDAVMDEIVGGDQPGGETA